MDLNGFATAHRSSTDLRFESTRELKVTEDLNGFATAHRSSTDLRFESTRELKVFLIYLKCCAYRWR